MKNLFRSLSGFQYEVPIIYKQTDGYGYKYTSLPTIIEVITPLLKKHGLGFTQTFNGNTLTTTIFHVESGEKLESSIEMAQGVFLKGMNDFQVAGSAITYYRRYSLSAILGLVTEKDNDGAGEKVKQKTGNEAPKEPKTPALINGKPEFNMSEFEKNKAVVQKYINDGESFQKIKTRLSTKYSGTTADVKAIIESMKPILANV